MTSNLHQFATVGTYHNGELGVQDATISDPMSALETPRLLFIDAYDSFSYNVVTQLRQSLTTIYPNCKTDISIIQIDDERFIGQSKQKAFLDFLQGFDAVVLGPGPGNPGNADDIGLFRTVLTLTDVDVLPVLGVCLGFQSMCLIAGAQIERLREPRHGVPTPITHSSDAVFAHVGEIRATQYHSLHVVLNHPLQESHSIDAAPPEALWQPSAGCPSILPLAWDIDDVENGPVLMAVKIEDKPFWGVQFHPESIASNSRCLTIMSNFLQEASRWKQKGTSRTAVKSPPLNEHHHGKDVLLSQSMDRSNATLAHENGSSVKNGALQSHPIPTTTHNVRTRTDNTIQRMLPAFGAFEFQRDVTYKAIDLQQQFWCDPVGKLALCGVLPWSDDLVVLESGTRRDGSAVNNVTGQQTIIGFPDEDSTFSGVLIKYHLYKRRLSVEKNGSTIHQENNVDFWDYYGRMMRDFKCFDGHEDSRFWGGFVHVVSYEAGLETIEVDSTARTHVLENTAIHTPDVVLSLIRRSIVLDHAQRKCYVQSVRPNDFAWVDNTTRTILGTYDPAMTMSATAGRMSSGISTKANGDFNDYTRQAAQTFPEVMSLAGRQSYESKVRQCQEYIRAGDSYQLCLTAQTDITINLPKDDDHPSWTLFRRLMRNNPAPFGAFLRFGNNGTGLTLVSTSPERFLQWDRAGECEFRPMKGTYKKRPGDTIDDARQALSTVKEQAENLMITDLIRNDMHKLLPRVEVPKLMHVEEYETVFQMVSVITGQLEGIRATGLDVLRASLPPGSMTGTPKKRSCELLQQIEDHRPRGIYSGVVGYVDVGGNGDNAVVIRTAYKWDMEDKTNSDGPDFQQSRQETWHIGAGGAVTAKSTPSGEYDEMVVKRAPLLRAFLPETPDDHLNYIEKRAELPGEGRKTVSFDARSK